VRPDPGGVGGGGVQERHLTTFPHLKRKPLSPGATL
jgi:hypothetical protein